MKGNDKVELLKVTNKEEKKNRSSPKFRSRISRNLFDELKKLRIELPATKTCRRMSFFPTRRWSKWRLICRKTTEMLKISGVGDVKMDKYGLDFLRTVKDYCLRKQRKVAHRFEDAESESKQRTKRNADGDDTYKITLKMFHGGATIEEIAEERNLSANTIETHLVRFIQTGEVKLTEIVAEEKIEDIRKAILELNAEQGISPIKAYLGEDFTYGEIRAVIADFMRIGQGAKGGEKRSGGVEEKRRF